MGFFEEIKHLLNAFKDEINPLGSLASHIVKIMVDKNEILLEKNGFSMLAIGRGGFDFLEEIRVDEGSVSYSVGYYPLHSQVTFNLRKRYYLEILYAALLNVSTNYKKGGTIYFKFKKGVMLAIKMLESLGYEPKYMLALDNFYNEKSGLFQCARLRRIYHGILRTYLLSRRRKIRDRFWSDALCCFLENIAVRAGYFLAVIPSAKLFFIARRYGSLLKYIISEVLGAHIIDSYSIKVSTFSQSFRGERYSIDIHTRKRLFDVSAVIRCSKELGNLSTNVTLCVFILGGIFTFKVDYDSLERNSRDFTGLLFRAYNSIRRHVPRVSFRDFESALKVFLNKNWFFFGNVYWDFSESAARFLYELRAERRKQVVPGKD